jgi:RNA polymerase sigma-70 factor (ECF subfamily)
MSAEHLIRACAESNDGAAWNEFVSRFHRAICLSIIRAAYQWGQSPQQVVDDLAQETYLKLCADKCRQVLEFAVHHPEAVTGYIKTIAVNVTRDYFKAFNSQKRGSGKVGQSPEHIEPTAGRSHLSAQEAIEREVLLKQINHRLEGCSSGPDQERDRMIFWLYYQQGMSAKNIAGLPTICLTAKGVESVIFRLTRLVREQIVGSKSQPVMGDVPGEKDSVPQNRIRREVV